jgi:hypothetical protein
VHVETKINKRARFQKEPIIEPIPVKEIIPEYPTVVVIENEEEPGERQEVVERVEESKRNKTRKVEKEKMPTKRTGRSKKNVVMEEEPVKVEKRKPGRPKRKAKDEASESELTDIKKSKKIRSGESESEASEQSEKPKRKRPAPKKRVVFESEDSEDEFDESESESEEESEIEVKPKKGSKKRTAYKPKPTKTKIDKPIKRLSDRGNVGIFPPDLGNTKINKIEEKVKYTKVERKTKRGKVDESDAGKRMEILLSIDKTRLSNIKSGKRTGTYSLKDLKEFANKLQLPTLRTKPEYIEMIKKELISEGVAEASDFST